jgi:hypothetical protein
VRHSPVIPGCLHHLWVVGLVHLRGQALLGAWGCGTCLTNQARNISSLSSLGGGSGEDVGLGVRGMVGGGGGHMAHIMPAGSTA